MTFATPAGTPRTARMTRANSSARSANPTGYDVAVVGGGIVGAAVAAELAGRGARTAVLDSGRVASGTSAHCEGNLLVSDKAPGPELELAVLGNAQWREFSDQVRDELGEDFPDVEFEAKGGIVAATTEAGGAHLLNFADTQRSAGVTAHVLDRGDLRDLEPWLTDRVTAAVLYPDDCQVQPTIAAEALIALARSRGADVLEMHEVTGALRTPGGVVSGVMTTSGPVHAGATVIASGPWSGSVARRLGAHLPVRPRRGVVLVTAPMPLRIRHKVYDADYVGAVGSGDGGLMTSAVVEATRGGTVLVGSSREQVGFDDRFRADVLRAIAAKAVTLFPFLADTAVIRSYSGFRPYLPDHLPAIGPDIRNPGLWFVTGHEGAGIGLSLPSARMLADLMDGTPPGTDPTPFSPHRPGLLARPSEEPAA